MFYERAPSKREVKYINVTMLRARKRNYKFPFLDTMNSFQTAHHVYPQQSEQGLMYNWKKQSYEVSEKCKQLSAWVMQECVNTPLNPEVVT